MTTCVFRRTVYSLVLGLNPDCFDGKDWETYYPDCFDGKSWERYAYSGLNPDCFDGKDWEHILIALMGNLGKDILTAD